MIRRFNLAGDGAGDEVPLCLFSEIEWLTHLFNEICISLFDS
jgi:hypothetical protein